MDSALVVAVDVASQSNMDSSSSTTKLVVMSDMAGESSATDIVVDKRTLTGARFVVKASQKDGLTRMSSNLFTQPGQKQLLDGGAAHTLFAFLEKHAELPKFELLPKLNALTDHIMAETSDSGLHDLLVDTYRYSKGEFPSNVNFDDLLGDLKALTVRRNNKVSSTLRASQVGVRNTIKSFAPDLLMYYTLEEKFHMSQRQLCPFSTFFDGVALLADISGFTRLSGKFCERGKDGIDQLQQVVNGYLGQLVKIIYAYGGDVMKFAGDALVCVFLPGKIGDGEGTLTMADVCSNAIQCAKELAECCTDTLTVHNAISCGSICFAMLGGFGDQYECLTSGECFGHLSQCLDDAASKQTVVSPQLVEMLGPTYRKELNIEQLSSGNYLVISAAVMTSAVVQKMIKKRGEMLMKDSESRFSQFPNDPEFLTAIGYFVPAPVSVGLVSGSFDLLAELREVTTMFMSWDSYDEAEHRNLLSLQKCFYAAQKVLDESKGFIRQFLVDDKGCVLIACWGVPTASHPDNARRAVCAGAMISRELLRLNMKTSVGITTGNVFCGSVGSYVRREYAVIGDVVNLAARLMGKSKGGIYIDEATFSRIPPFLKAHMEKLDEIKVKGKDVPITPYALKQGKRISLDEKDAGEKTIGAMTIRTVCMQPLMEGMERITNTKQPVSLRYVLIEGKPGTGKIEVVDWLKATGPKMNVRIVSVRMTGKDLGRDYSVLSQMFRMLVREDIFDNEDRQRVVVQHILRAVFKNDREAAERVGYPTMRIALGITAPLDDTQPQARRDHKKGRLPSAIITRTLRNIFAYLLQEAPVVYVVEHAHHADMHSWRVLHALSGVNSLALGVITMDTIEDLELLENSPSVAIRDEIFTATETPLSLGRLKLFHQRLVREPTTTMVLMNDYSVEEVENLICNALHVAVCPEGLGEMVHQLSGGSPYWSREMALFIQSTGPEEFMRAMIAPGLRDPDDDPKASHPNSASNSQRPAHVDDRRSSLRGLAHPGTATPVSTGPSTTRGTSTEKSTSSSPRTHRKTSTQYTKMPTPFTAVVSTQHATAMAAMTSRNANSYSFHTKLQSFVNVAEARNPANGLHTTATSSKLSVFIVCRFEKLTNEDQNLLRSASIIGLEFTRDILYGILSPKMRTHMFNSLQSLIKNQWLKEKKPGADEYRFVHPLLYQTLYDLTPASDKGRLHSLIASYIEDAYDGNPQHFAQLGYHYGMSKECRPKAVEYYVRAAVHVLESGLDAYDEGLELLGQAGLYADSAFDYGAILGVIMEAREHVAATKKQMQKALLAAKEPPQDGKTGGDSKEGGGWRSWKFLTVGRSRKAVPAEDAVDVHEAALSAGNLTLEQVSELLAKYDVVEQQLTEAFDAMVLENNLGTILAWQKPLLMKKKDIAHMRTGGEAAGHGAGAGSGGAESNKKGAKFNLRHASSLVGRGGLKKWGSQLSRDRDDDKRSRASNPNSRGPSKRKKSTSDARARRSSRPDVDSRPGVVGPSPRSTRFANNAVSPSPLPFPAAPADTAQDFSKVVLDADGVGTSPTKSKGGCHIS